MYFLNMMMDIMIVMMMISVVIVLVMIGMLFVGGGFVELESLCICISNI